MAYNPKDFYFRKAKEKNFAARSVFKLEEIDERFHILKPGMKILDLGCAPGSWSQYTSKAIKKSGFCIAIDLQKVLLALPNVDFHQGDAFDPAVLKELMEKHGIDQFDVVLSDMAPKTTGIRLQDQRRSYELCQRALGVAQEFLRPGGFFVTKFFHSEFFEDFLKEMRPMFLKTELLRPKSTRKESYEIFLVGLKKTSRSTAADSASPTRP